MRKLSHSNTNQKEIVVLLLISEKKEKKIDLKAKGFLKEKFFKNNNPKFNSSANDKIFNLHAPKDIILKYIQVILRIL